MSDNAKVRTCLWFVKDGAVAADFYCSLLPESEVTSRFGQTPDGEPLLVDFTLGGAPFQILTGGPYQKQTEAVSISVMTENQAETDRLWHALIADGGAESECGWLKDRWGVSWQIVPRQLMACLSGPDAAGAKRATDAMFTMKKIDIAAIEAAYKGQ